MIFRDTDVSSGGLGQRVSGRESWEVTLDPWALDFYLDIWIFPYSLDKLEK